MTIYPSSHFPSNVLASRLRPFQSLKDFGQIPSTFRGKYQIQPVYPVLLFLLLVRRGGTGGQWREGGGGGRGGDLTDCNAGGGQVRNTGRGGAEGGERRREARVGGPACGRRHDPSRGGKGRAKLLFKVRRAVLFPRQPTARFFAGSVQHRHPPSFLMHGCHFRAQAMLQSWLVGAFEVILDGLKATWEQEGEKGRKGGRRGKREDEYENLG